jgi:glycosyltransferase involved in cell wall biosynthesis
VDLLIDACNRLKRRLVIVGQGRELAALKKLAGPTIEFTGWVSREQLSTLYARCKALLFAAQEDFGIVPLECQSYGRPVIAYGCGGTLETVIPGVTGVLFKEQRADSLMQAILGFEREQTQYDPFAIQANACLFDTSEFKRRLSDFVVLCMEAKRTGRRWTQLENTTTLLTAGETSSYSR